MAFFDNLKTLLKQKWLQFFQVNRSWITFYMEVESVYTPDGGRRPPSSFILGVVNALEPQLAELMLPFSKLNPDADTLIDVLELNFDPDLLLGNRFNPQVVTEELSDDIVIQALTELDPDELSDMSLDDMADEVVLVQTDDESVMVLSPDEAAALVDDMALDDMADEVVLVQTDDESVMVLSPDEAYALADAMALDEMADHGDPEGTSIDQSLETPPHAPQQNESSDVLSDVWVEDAASSSEQVGNETRLGENKKSEDDEISRLFPNL
jgi:predicted regulator of Ras-like GTPase activity (Roadblock/LC7/MglB family)